MARSAMARLGVAAAGALLAGSAVVAGADSVLAPSDGDPVPPPAVTAPAGRTWRLTFADEFDGSAVDRSRWTTCWDWTVSDCSRSATALGGLERYTPGQVRVRDGVATLVAQRLAKPRRGQCYQGRCTHRSGLLTTARPGSGRPYRYVFRYGYAEARIEVSAAPGLWSTFWLLPRRTDLRGDYTHEIDVLEAAGERAGTTLQTYHYAGRTRQFRARDCPPLATAGFHTYGVDWRPDSITFYRDGQACGRFSDAANIYDKPVQLILELMVYPSTSRSGGLSLTDVPAGGRMVVDYCRVWRSVPVTAPPG